MPRFRPLFPLLVLSSCARAPAPSLAPALAPTVSPAPSPPPTPAPASAAPSAPPSDTFHYPCSLDLSHSPVILALEDDGPTFQLATAPTLAGPFTPFHDDTDRTAFRTVLDGDKLRDPDLVATFQAAGAKPEDVARITVYGIAIRGGWSFGLALFTGPRGDYIGRAGWGMRVGFAHPCDVADGG